MSLLMDALRKAEEAKSKASQDEKGKPPADTAQAPKDDSASPGNTDLRNADSESVEDSTLVTEAENSAPEHGPAVINPDPDEEETLAAHANDSGLELVALEEEQDVEQIEFTPSTPAGTESLSQSFTEDDNEDDGLSLLQSSYFNRTQNTHSNNVDDDERELQELKDDDDTQSSDETLNETLAQETRTESRAVEKSPPRAREFRPATAAAESAANETSADNTDSIVADRKRQEKAKRESAGALFLAKEDSQKRRTRKLVSIAAIVLIIPVAGIVYWLTTSLNSGPTMQFNVPADSNLANRSFSDTNAQPEQSPAGLATDSAVPQGEAAETESESTATALMAVADNTDDSIAAAEPPVPAADTAPDIAPLADTGNSVIREEQTPEVAISEPVPAPPVQENIPAENVGDNTPVQATAQATGLRITLSAAEQVINPDLNAAYDSYQQGDYVSASRLYQQVLAREPNNRDAMLHLATVSLKQNNPSMARNLYARLLELNPRDPLARAGILETVQGDPVRQEAELKSLVSAYPATAQLSFALGNLYATQNRWNEAQSAYFTALLAAKSNNTGPVSPDYAFNLAVSLERISQPRAALDYYREAETLSRNSAPGFDPALLDQRLNTLEQRLR